MLNWTHAHQAKNVHHTVSKINLCTRQKPCSHVNQVTATHACQQAGHTPVQLPAGLPGALSPSNHSHDPLLGQHSPSRGHLLGKPLCISARKRSYLHAHTTGSAAEVLFCCTGQALCSRVQDKAPLDTSSGRQTLTWPRRVEATSLARRPALQGHSLGLHVGLLRQGRCPVGRQRGRLLPRRRPHCSSRHLRLLRLLLLRLLRPHSLGGGRLLLLLLRLLGLLLGRVGRRRVVACRGRVLPCTQCQRRSAVCAN